MKAEELRIGNWVQYDTKNVTIVDISLLKVGGYEVDFSDGDYGHIDSVDPIPLTPEWLEMFDFEKDDDKEYEDIHWHKGIFSLFISRDFPDGFDYPLLMRYGNPREFKSAIGVPYVHKLQNLYYAVEATELIKQVKVTEK